MLFSPNIAENLMRMRSNGAKNTSTVAQVLSRGDTQPAIEILLATGTAGNEPLRQGKRQPKVVRKVRDIPHMAMQFTTFRCSSEQNDGEEGLLELLEETGVSIEI